MTKYLLFAFVFILFLFVPHIAVNSLFTEKPSQEKLLSIDGLWSLVQEWRSKNGFQPYTKDQNLCKITESRTEDLKGKIMQNFNHDQLVERYKNYPSKLSENITGASSNNDALSKWLNSPSHAEALRHSYKYSCIAVRDSFAVQIFSNCENGCP